MSSEREISQERREQIERRAYELYLQRREGWGSDLEDWLAAEREIVGRQDDIETTPSLEGEHATAMHNENAAPAKSAATEPRPASKDKKANRATAGGKSDS